MDRIEISLRSAAPLRAVLDGTPEKAVNAQNTTAAPVLLAGDSAYEIAVANGFEGSQTEWLESLKGEPGADGTDGTTPHIGANGNWFIGDTDTGIPSRGEPGADGQDGSPGQDGTDGKSAYQTAVDGGYEGSEEEFAEALAGIGSEDDAPAVTTPDWNQNDPTQPDYIKNRTHGSVREVIVPEMAPAFEDVDGTIAAAIPLESDVITAGAALTVNYGGTEYICTVVSVEGMLLFGDTTLVGGSVSNGEPFTGFTEGALLILIPLSENLPDVFSVSAEYIMRMDKKYLPPFKPDTIDLIELGMPTVTNESTAAVSIDMDTAWPVISEILSSGRAEIRVRVTLMMPELLSGTGSLSGFTESEQFINLTVSSCDKMDGNPRRYDAYTFYGGYILYVEFWQDLIEAKFLKLTDIYYSI